MTRARPATVTFLALLPIALTLLAITPYGRTYGFDFRVFVGAAHDVLAGHSPYPELTASTIAQKQNFVYPPALAVLFVPFALLPFWAGAAIWSLLMLACVPATLYVLGVRDWRCYGAALLWMPSLLGVRLGSISPLLVLGLALLWRYRDDRRFSVPLLAALVVSKLFLWPLVFWFLFTRRRSTAVWAAATGVGACVLAWSVIGFAGVGTYPHLLGLLARVEQRDGFSPLSLLLGLGAPLTVARVGVLVLGAGIFGVAVAASRSHASAVEIDRRLLIATVALALALSPIVWGHYLMLLLVPVAISQPRFGILWLLPAWILPDQHSIVVLALAVLTVLVEFALCWRAKDGPALAEGGVDPHLSAEAKAPLPDLSLKRRAALAESSAVAVSQV